MFLSVCWPDGETGFQRRPSLRVNGSWTHTCDPGYVFAAATVTNNRQQPHRRRNRQGTFAHGGHRRLCSHGRPVTALTCTLMNWNRRLGRAVALTSNIKPCLVMERNREEQLILLTSPDTETARVNSCELQREKRQSLNCLSCATANRRNNSSGAEKAVYAFV